MSNKDRASLLSGINKKVGAYLKVMVKNRCLDKLRTENNRNSIHNGIISLFNRYSFNDAMVESDYLELIEFLPEQQRKVFEMHLDGFDNESIAEKLGVSYNTVRNTLSTSKKKLRILWNKLM